MKITQTTIFGEPKLKIRNRKSKNKNGLKFFKPTEENFESIIDDLENIHKRTRFTVGLSGGKDSVSTAHKLDQMGKLDSCFHIKTNIGIQKTTDFVQELCDDMGWKLHIVEPQPKFVYVAFCLQYGFPTGDFHRLIMGYLKYHSMRNFALTLDKKNHCIISGVRKFESERRFGNYPEPIQTDGSVWWGCPRFYDTTEEVYRDVHENGLRITPIHEILGFSGECMCGSYATAGQKQQIRDIDPKLADFIEWIEVGVSKFGTNQAKSHAKWGGYSKMSDLEKQQTLKQFFEDNPDLEIVNDIEKLVCGDECGAGIFLSDTCNYCNGEGKWNQAAQSYMKNHICQCIVLDRKFCPVCHKICHHDTTLSPKQKIDPGYGGMSSQESYKEEELILA